MATQLLTACRQLLQADAPIRLRITGGQGHRDGDAPGPSAAEQHPKDHSAAGGAPAAPPPTSQHAAPSPPPLGTPPSPPASTLEDVIAREGEGRAAPGLGCPCCRGASASPGIPCCSTYELRNAFINRPYSLDGPEAVRVLRCTECPGNCNCYHGERPVVLPALPAPACCGGPPPSTGGPTASR
eukprot:EG_transcript_34508